MSAGPTVLIVKETPPAALESTRLPDASLVEDGAEALPAAAETALAAEVAALRQELRDLRQTVDARVGTLVLELRAENRRLREEVARLRGGGTGYSSLTDYIPRPGHPSSEDTAYSAGFEGGVPLSQVIEELRAEAEATPPTPGAAEQEEALPASQAEPQGPVAAKPLEFLPEGYAIVRQWGRSPEEAEALGSGVSSLRGMVLVTPPSRTDEELMALGRQLRAESAGYGNVNIEVFDSEEAARQFIETSQAPSERRVLQVSRHRASGNDAIYLWRHGLAIDVPLTE